MIESLAIHLPHDPSRPRAGRTIDTAVGILVGLRRCSTRAAFTELLSASRRHDVPMFKFGFGVGGLGQR